MFCPRRWLTFFILSLLVISITLHVFETKVKAAEALGGEVTTTFASGQGFLTTGNLKGDDNPVVIWTDSGFGGGTVSMVPATGGSTVTLASGQRFSQSHTIFLASGQGSVGNVTTGNLKGDDDPVVIWTANDTISMVSAVGGSVQVLLSHVKYIDGIAVGDFNGDGKLDVVVNSSTFTQDSIKEKSTIWMLLGNGDGTFQLPHTYSTDAPLGDLVVDDFNSDGKLDIATSSWSGGTISVLLSNGDGTFQLPHTYSVGSSPPKFGSSSSQIVVDDFNSDGKLDIATDNFNNTVSVLLGNGDGTFQLPRTYSVGSSPSKFGSSSSQIVVGDFNSDGKLDIATVYEKFDIATNYWNYTISVLLNNGDGTFQPEKTTSLPVYDMPIAWVAGDFGGNGKLAIAAAVSAIGSDDAELLMLRGNGDGTFQSPTKEVVIPGFIAGIAITDFKRNKKPGIYWIESNGKVRGLISNGDGTFQAPRTLALTTKGVSGIVVGDFGKAVLNVAPGDGYTVDEPYNTSLF